MCAEKVMSLNEAVKEMRELLNAITIDLDKAETGNKAAAQRVRTGTVRMEKLAKVYRKQSIQREKEPGTSKRASPKKTTGKETAHKGKAKAKTAVAKAKARSLRVKRPTAKLPSRLGRV